MKTEFLTIEQAKEQGYKYAYKLYHEDNGIIAIDKCDKGHTWILCKKEPVPFSISDDLIQSLVDDYLCNQDEVADEDGRLNDLAAEVDYSEITQKLNEVFSKTKYYYPTKIRLVV